VRARAIMACSPAIPMISPASTPRSGSNESEWARARSPRATRSA
jgi:hypothetical protein